MAKLELIATTAFGLEAVVAQELRNLGYTQLTVENGKVIFTCNELGLCRANLWLRSADRVLLKITEFPATTFEELFQQTRALPWEEYLPADAEFPVLAKSVKSRLFSLSDCQAIVKKAIVERLKETYGGSWFPENGARYTIEVSLIKDQATLTIDTSGAGLHKRGYRQLAGQAPLKETLAAAMIQLSRWNKDRALIDPMCGTGTIPIEAAMIAQNRAPGLKRRFAAEEWPNFSAELWEEARTEGHDLWQREQKLHIYGSDISHQALQLARVHAADADLADKIYFQKLPAREVGSRFEYGHLITNPPYGERLGEREEADTALSDLGTALARLETWSLHVITTNKYPETLIGRRWDKSRKLYNGRLECHFYQFWGPKPPRRPRPETEETPALIESTESEGASR